MEDTNNSKTGSSDSLIHIMKTKDLNEIVFVDILVHFTGSSRDLLQLLDQTKHFWGSSIVLLVFVEDFVDEFDNLIEIDDKVENVVDDVA